jgi:hypothetical protein
MKKPAPMPMSPTPATIMVTLRRPSGVSGAAVSIANCDGAPIPGEREPIGAGNASRWGTGGGIDEGRIGGRLEKGRSGMLEGGAPGMG